MWFFVVAENELFQLFVRATDMGSPPQENDVPVEVYVMGEKDAPPTFAKPTYKYFISEDHAVGSVIATVNARNSDTLTYSIVAGALDYTNNPGKFAINDNGQVRIYFVLLLVLLSVFIDFFYIYIYIFFS